MPLISVKGERPYPVIVKHDCFTEVGEGLTAMIHAGEKVVIVSDDRVGALYAASLEEEVKAAGFSAATVLFPHGEENKSVEQWLGILAFFNEYGLPRTGAVIALGGGVTGDMAGFAAACWVRGVRLIQIPTSLLAMVDSSVGGKTGLDFAERKNSLGSFYPPSAVFCDPALLSTLPKEEWISGGAEVLKYGVLFSHSLFDRLREGKLQTEAESVIAECVGYKARLVAEDERDFGARRLLNLGHTFGHAAEAVSGYRVSHGQAVGWGMVCAARLARKLGLCDRETEEEIRAAVKSIGLPLELGMPVEELVHAALGDKKRESGSLPLILPEEIGRCRVVTSDIEETACHLRVGFAEEETDGAF